MDGNKILAHGALARGEAKQARLAEMNRKLQEQRDRDAAALKQAGFEERNPARYSGDETRHGTRPARVSQQISPDVQVSVAEPPAAPVQASVSEPMLAPIGTARYETQKSAFHFYHTAANSDRGKGFVEFTRSLGLIPENACGITGGQELADRVSAILYADDSFFRWDRDGRIQRHPQIPQ